jgi:hypothetical protein
MIRSARSRRGSDPWTCKSRRPAIGARRRGRGYASPRISCPNGRGARRASTRCCRSSTCVGFPRATSGSPFRIAWQGTRPTCGRTCERAVPSGVATTTVSSAIGGVAQSGIRRVCKLTGSFVGSRDSKVRSTSSKLPSFTKAAGRSCPARTTWGFVRAKCPGTCSALRIRPLPR